jgi:hypothetical protein
MGSRARSSTATRKQIVKKRKADLDQLSTREAQVLRMRHGVSEPPSAVAGRPAKGTDASLRKRLQAVEEEVRDRIRDGVEEASQGDDDTKSKIVRGLKKMD